MTYKGLFIDDQEPVWAETLSTPGLLEFVPLDVEEVAVLAGKIVAGHPMIVAIDYRLDEVPTNLPPNQTFRGSGLAQHLRDASIEHPERDFAMVLVSAEGKIKRLYRPDKTAHDLFDRVYVKEEINVDRSSVRTQLVSLCAGDDKLRAVGKRFDVVELMAGTEEDRPHVDIQEIRAKLDDAAAPHVASRIVFGLIDRPGPLLDIKDVCGYLGLDFGDGDSIGKVLTAVGIDYRGVFAEAWPRWWANRLEKWAHAKFKRRATGLPASDRAKILSDATGQHFNPARSTWNKSPDELIAFACASCRLGAELRHSVAAFEPVQLRYATRRRICWDCIQTDRYESNDPPLAVDEADLDLAEQVKTRDRNDGQAEAEG